MTRGIENTLLTHGGTEDIDIPSSALQTIINDALKPDCDDKYEALQRQNEALEEANQRLAKRIARLECENLSLKQELDGMEYE